MEKTAERVLDEYLLSLSQSGSLEALDGLARRWTPRLLRYATRVLGGSGDAAETARDVVQETWLAVVRGLGSLRDPAQFPSWIYGIATRKCVDAIRGKTRRRALDAGAAGGGVEPRPAVSPEEQIDLAKAVRQLPPLHRAVVHLFYREAFSVDEIAGILGVPAGTIKSRLHHAREALRQQLAG